MIGKAIIYSDDNKMVKRIKEYLDKNLANGFDHFRIEIQENINLKPSHEIRIEFKLKGKSRTFGYTIDNLEIKSENGLEYLLRDMKNRIEDFKDGKIEEVVRWV
ncbi:MAG: hypothetical protein ACRCX8_06770 [Sarcina sp.]